MSGKTNLIKGKYAKKRGRLLLGKIIFDGDKILISYLFKKKAYSISEIDYIKYTFYCFSRGGSIKYFEIGFNDKTEIFVHETRKANSIDECRNYIKSNFKEKFINNEIERFSDEIEISQLKDIKKVRESIKIWGEWFGGRIGEAVLTLKKYDIDEKQNKITIIFDNNETCEIISPKKIYNSRKSFYIRQADKIIFTSYYYGRPQLKENIIQTTYIKIKNTDKVQVLETGAMGKRNEVIKTRNINALDF